MNEFLKLVWDTQIDSQVSFLSEETVADSYVYKSFTKSLKAKPKKSLKLQSTESKYVPGKSYFRLIPRRSLLTKSQKSHCLAALKLIQGGKSMELMTAGEKSSIQIYTECQPKIIEENQNFLQHVQNIWNKNQGNPQKIKPMIMNYSWHHWQQRIARYLEYPQFYKEVSSICLTYNENESTVNYEHILNPLELGALARFSAPSLQEPCYLKIVTLPEIEENTSLNYKLPVSQDQNVIKLLESHQFDVVMSSSGLKQIIDYTNTKAKWIIPVVIKEISVNETKKKIIFIDKVLPKGTPSVHDLKYYAYKQLLKSNFCYYKAFSFPAEESSVANVSDSDNSDSDEASDTSLQKVKTKKKRKIHHNVSYRIWNIKKTDNHSTLMKNKIKNKEIRMLVRCKLDACESTEQGTLLPIIIKPKIEQQIQYGANIPSKSELAREWASLFFRIYSNLYRARLFGPKSEVVSVEKCSIQKINAEALTHYNYKPILGLGVLQKVMEELTNLECGNYLLQHLPKHEYFLSLLKQCDTKDASYDLHAECEGSQIDFEAKQMWLPVDVKYILPAHEEYDLLPATFRGFDSDNQGVGKKKKKKGVKNKKKVATKGKKQGEKDEPLL